jgi:hypothetical protein
VTNPWGESVDRSMGEPVDDLVDCPWTILLTAFRRVMASSFKRVGVCLRFDGGGWVRGEATLEGGSILFQDKEPRSYFCSETFAGRLLR